MKKANTKGVAWLGLDVLKQADNSKQRIDAESDIARAQANSRYSKRYFGFRFAAILIGLSPFLLLEVSLYTAGWKQADGVKDPYVGFVESSRLFTKNSSTGEFEIAASRKPLFCADSFPAQKPANEFRIFCVGGSTVQGRPFAIETAFRLGWN